MGTKIRLLALSTAICACVLDASARADTLAQLTRQRLEAVHGATALLKSQRQEPRRSGPLREYRAAIHLHSARTRRQATSCCVSSSTPTRTASATWARTS